MILDLFAIKQVAG